MDEIGFGVLTQIDIEKTLKEILGEEFRSYLIISAFDPPLAHRTVSIDPAINLMLPCNVTVEDDNEGVSIIRLLDSKVMISFGKLKEGHDPASVADEAHDKIERVAISLRK